jgi:hypothetical protein
LVIKYLDSKRISGITADRTGTPAISGGWKELGRTTLGSTADTVSVSSLDDKRYFMVLCDNRTTGAVRMNMRFNSDSGSNYSERWSAKGATDLTQVSQNKMQYGQSYVDEQGFSVHNIANLTNKEKLMMAHIVSDDASTGAGTAPYRNEYISKWVPSTASDVINEIAMYNTSAGSWNIGAECVVLGWDPADTHTTNFWEELGSHTLSTQSNELDVSFTAKKYIWYQAFISKDATASNYTEHSINGITTGNTWARRLSTDGGADGTSTSQNTINTTNTGAGGYFINGFVINNSGNEKLFIEHVTENLTSGAGTAPNRKEAVFKSTTSAQITQLTLTGATNGYEAPSTLKVWGSN